MSKERLFKKAIKIVENPNARIAAAATVGLLSLAAFVDTGYPFTPIAKSPNKIVNQISNDFPGFSPLKYQISQGMIENFEMEKRENPQFQASQQVKKAIDYNHAFEGANQLYDARIEHERSKKILEGIAGILLALLSLKFIDKELLLKKQKEEQEKKREEARQRNSNN